MHIYQATRFIPLPMGISGALRSRIVYIFRYLFPVGTGIYEIADGIMIDTSNPNELALFYFFFNVVRYYRLSPLYRYMRLHLRRGDVFVDVGANLGMYAYLSRSLGCTALAFEPEPQHAAFLSRNKQVADFAFAVALGDQDGEAPFHIADHGNAGASSLVMSNRGWARSGYRSTIPVRVRRMDSLITDPSLVKRIRLIKIDVEGAEDQVVRGMEKILRYNHAHLWCEVRGERSDRNPTSYARVTAFLDTLGYRPYVFDGRLRNFSARHVRQVFDLVFLPTA